MVKNVSRKLVGGDDKSNSGLSACKICKPPSVSNLNLGNSLTNKAVGESISVRCNGVTQKGTGCKHMTKLSNGFCYQHTSRNKSPNPYSSDYLKSSSTTPICGARTKSGGYCQRKVKNGGRCYQH